MTDRAFRGLNTAGLKWLFAAMAFTLALALLPVAALADTADIYPNALHAVNDDTGELFGEHATVATNPATQATVVAGDGVITIRKGKVHFIDGFDTAALSGTIDSVTLNVKHGGQAGGGATLDVRWALDGGGLASTGITPLHSAWTIETYDLYAQGVDTIAEITSLDIEYTSNDSGSGQAINFDYIYLTVVYTPVSNDSLEDLLNEGASATSDVNVGSTADLLMQWIQVDSDNADDGKVTLSSLDVTHNGDSTDITDVDVYINSSASLGGATLIGSDPFSAGSQTVALDLGGTARDVADGDGFYILVVYVPDGTATASETMITRVTAIGVSGGENGLSSLTYDSNTHTFAEAPSDNNDLDITGDIGGYIDSPYGATATFGETYPTVASCQFYDGSSWGAATPSGSGTVTCTASNKTCTDGAALNGLSMRATNTQGTATTTTTINLTCDTAGPINGALTVGVLDSSASVSWTAYDDDGAVGLKSANSHVVTYQTGSYPACGAGNASFSGTTNPHSYSQGSLSNGTPYYFTLCVYDEFDNVTVAQQTVTPAAIDTITVSDSVAVATFAKGGDTLVAVGSFQLQTNSGTYEVDDITITGTNNTFGEVAAGGAYVYEDTNDNNVFDGPDTEVGGGGDSFADTDPDTVVIDNGGELNISVTTTPQVYFIVYDIAASPTNGNVLTAYVSDVTHTAGAKSVVDNAAGESLTIDTAAPTTTSSGDDGGAYTFNTWTTNNVTVTLTPGDGGGSGVASTQYCTPGTGCTPDTGYAPFSVTCSAGSECTKYVGYRSTDNVGIVESTSEVIVKIDKKGPTGSFDASGTNSGEITLVFSDWADGGSGLNTGTTYVIRRANNTQTAPANCASGDAVYSGTSNANIADTGLDPALDYAYRLCVFDESGNLTETTDWSLADGSGCVSSISVCSDCHSMGPPDSGGGRDMATGAVEGTHDITPHVPSGADTDCAVCHGAAVTSYSFNHRDGNINMDADIVGGSYNKGTSFAQTNNPTLDTCNSVYCHSNVQTSGGTAGEDTYNVPTWGGSVACAACHGNGPSTGSHPVHLNDIAGDVSNPASVCDDCHSAGGDGTTKHANSLIEVTGITYSQGEASAPGSGGFGTCATASCHTNVQDAGGASESDTTTNAWGSGVVACGECHSTTPTTGSHTKHLSSSGNNMGANAACGDCHTSEDAGTHMDGNIDISHSYPAVNPPLDGYDNCTNATACHTNIQDNGGGATNTVTATPTWGAVTTCGECHSYTDDAGGDSLTSGTHSKHLENAGLNTDCGNCHDGAGDGSSVAANHRNGSINVGGGSTDVGSYGSSAVGDNYQNCNNISCHGGKSATWGGGALTCTSCHNNGTDNGALGNAHPATGEHTIHVAETDLISCANCHGAGANGGTQSGHRGGSTSTGGDLTDWNGTNCLNSCHLTSRDGGGVTADWTDSTSVACTDCHSTGKLADTKGVPLPASGTGLHGVSAAGVQKHDDTLSNNGCQECHATSGGGMPAATHLNNSFTADNGSNTDRDIDRSDLTFADGAANTSTCTGSGIGGVDCHSDGGNWRRLWSTDADSTETFIDSPRCQVCHGSWSSLSNSTGWNEGTSHYYNATRGEAQHDNPASCDACHAYVTVGGKHENDSITVNNNNTTPLRTGNTYMTDHAGCAQCHGGAADTDHQINVSFFGRELVVGPAITMACGACHADGGLPPTGGSHTAHQVDADADYAECQICHDDNGGSDWDNGGGANHNNAVVNINATGITWSSPNCQTSICHSGAGTNIAWGGSQTCTICHNNGTDDGDKTVNANPGTGPHENHLTGANNTTNAANRPTCGDCHTVPANGDFSHISNDGGSVAAILFDMANAEADEATIITATWDDGNNRCGNTACHDPLSQSLVADWDTDSFSCALCHGNPPAPGGTDYRHPKVSAGSCTGCHTHQGTGSPATHLDGSTPDLSGVTCTTCHNNGTDDGDKANAYPTGTNWMQGADAVGAHAKHTGGLNTIMPAITGLSCASTGECHTNYSAYTDAGHITGDAGYPADVTFPSPVYADLNSHTPAFTPEGTPGNGTGGTCSVYCHGEAMPGGATDGTDTTPAWTDTAPAACDTGWCHGVPPSGATHSGKTYPDDCNGCHPETTTDTSDPPAMGSTHINGTVEAAGECDSCHGVAITGKTINPRAIFGSDFGQIPNSGQDPDGGRHVFGSTATDGVTKWDCVVCHLEGDKDASDISLGAGNTEAVPDSTFHNEASTKVNLRNLDNLNDTSLTWDPNAKLEADYDNMDTHCLSCHDGDGSLLVVASGNDGTDDGPSATESVRPFSTDGLDSASTLAGSSAYAISVTLGYERQEVLDVEAQFATANESFHGLKAIGSAYDIQDSDWVDAAWTTYIPKGQAGEATDSLLDLHETAVLHCADCHSVDNDAGNGAHGGSASTDYMMAGASLVATCYICHNSNVYSNTGATGSRFDHSTDSKVWPYGTYLFANDADDSVCRNCHGGDPAADDPPASMTLGASGKLGYGGIHGMDASWSGEDSNHYDDGGSGVSGRYRFIGGVYMSFVPASDNWSSANGSNGTCYFSGSLPFSTCSQHSGTKGGGAAEYERFYPENY